MDASRLERLISDGTAATVRAQQLAAPALDDCLPGMVTAAKRAMLTTHRHDLAQASIYARFAMDSFAEASAMLATFLEPTL